ncbi:enoyl-CoA hydratase/isomerase family protein [Nocardioides astragali]|uniref:Enoyl-CoA hydratase/isomerase family protein n=1 Tax=Nocardioides astragali TaxID=1776736 RepID=A0ABW2N9A5_9ACTN|nr:enoyl-CoA hydratase-related protein [Nocardioides astragali]
MSDHSHPEIRYELSEAGVAVITLTRPEALNALTTEMATRRLPALCAEVTEDDRVKVVVLTGEGRAFCSGADVNERIPMVVSGSSAATKERLVGAFILPVWRIPKPVVAAVNGVAAGGGMSLACAADFRIVAQEASFVAAFVRRGLMPDSGITFLLPRLVSQSVATRLLMTGGSLTAAEAQAVGLADEVVPAHELLERATDFAEQLAAGPAVALSFTKRALQCASGRALADQLAFESWGQTVCFKTDDFAEGMAAFHDKRSPVFQGR